MVQRQNKKKKEVTPYDCMPPDSKGTLCRGDVFSVGYAPKRLIRPPNLFPDFHTKWRNLKCLTWNMTIPEMQETKISFLTCPD
jgi:hypothetical protein